MSSTTDSPLVTAAEVAHLLGVTRRRVLELAAAGADFPPAEPTATGGRVVWSRAAVQAWAASHHDPGPVSPAPSSHRTATIPADLEGHEPRRPRGPGAQPSLDRRRPPGARDAAPRQPGGGPEGAGVVRDPRGAVPPAVHRQHVLLALVGRGHFPSGWVARSGVTADAVRQRVVDATEGVALPEPPAPLEPPPAEPDPEGALDLAPNPLGHDPRRRHPWGSRGFGVPLDRPSKPGMLGRQYFIDRDGYPVLTTDGRPVHVVVDEDTVPVLDEHGHHRLGPVEIPAGAELITGPDPP